MFAHVASGSSASIPADRDSSTPQTRSRIVAKRLGSVSSASVLSRFSSLRPLAALHPGADSTADGSPRHSPSWEIRGKPRQRSEDGGHPAASEATARGRKARSTDPLTWRASPQAGRRAGKRHVRGPNMIGTLSKRRRRKGIRRSTCESSRA